MHPAAMTLSDLRARYAQDEVSNDLDDPALRRELFTPFLTNLHEGKVIYRERFICIVNMHEVETSTERFNALAEPILPVGMTGPFQALIPTRRWNFGASWAGVCLGPSSFYAPYGGWTIWPEPEIVKEVERLILADHSQAALKLIYDL